MRVLGIESSCDETSVAVIEAPNRIRSNVVASQVAAHAPYGGVVPELASRHHVRNIVVVAAQALREATCELNDLGGIAVTRGPGLVGALLVGLQFAKALAYACRLPWIGINHLEGHLSSPLLDGVGSAPPARHLALLVSGGHTALIKVERFGDYRTIAATRDDAAGEAFDKVAKMLGLPYPGGPVVERLAREGDPDAVAFPRALPARDELDFSFSGLKTAVLNYVERHRPIERPQLCDICASFQRAVSDTLSRKAARAASLHGLDAVVASGGVVANQAIRSALASAVEQVGATLYAPPLALCTDNAAMIAMAGLLRLQRGERSTFDLNAQARLDLETP